MIGFTGGGVGVEAAATSEDGTKEGVTADGAVLGATEGVSTVGATADGAVLEAAAEVASPDGTTAGAGEGAGGGGGGRDPRVGVTTMMTSKGFRRDTGQVLLKRKRLLCTRLKESVVGD